MYAVVEQGGKQYKVSQGQTINIDLADVAADATVIEMDKVLFLSDGEKFVVGAPYIKGAKVIAKFKTNCEDALVKGKKVYPMYFRRRKNSACRIGHRQKYLQVTIDKIQA